MKKAIPIAVCLSLIAAEAQAISRYDPTRMSCDRVQNLVDHEGAVILRYRSPRNPRLTLYDRYVASVEFCDMGELRSRASVPSADTGSCPVYRCKRPDFDRRRFILPFD